MVRKSLGFTLIEIMVVVAIVGLLSAVIYANFGESSAQSRDAKRKSDLRAMQAAIELYKNENGVYPEGCRGAGNWSGQNGSIHACLSGSEYVIDLAPEYIPKLPTDPKLAGGYSGYAYIVNAERSVYKFIIKNTVETETVDYNHSFKSCDASNSGIGVCDATHPSNNKPNWCFENNPQFMSSYAVWGGFVDRTNSVLVERYTEDIICDIQ